VLLSITSYVGRDTETVRDQLEAAVAPAASTAALRIGRPGDLKIVTATVADGIHVASELDELDGAKVSVSGDDSLAELRIELPWGGPGEAGRRYLAACTFAARVEAELLAG